MPEVDQLIKWITLIAINMQFPVLLLVIIFSRHAFLSLRIQEFKLIFWGWILNFLYLILVTLKYNLEFIAKDNTMSVLHQLVGIQDIIPFEISIFVLDFLCIFLFFIAIVKSSQNRILKLFKHKYLSISLFLTLFTLGVFRCIFIGEQDKTYKLITKIPLTVFFIIALLALAFFFKKLDRKYKIPIPYLSFGIIIYAAIQVLTLFDYDEPFYLIGFSIALVSKSLVAYGLHRLFLFHAEEYKNKELFADKLNHIIGRTFHELTRPLINMERDISRILNENDTDIKFSPKAKKLIERIEIHHSKAHANFVAHKRLYNLDIIKGKTNEKQNVIYEDKSISTSVNALMEISILTLKNLSEEKVGFITEYSSNCNIYCNPNEIIQVFDNILKNAYDAFPEGKGTIYIRTVNEKFQTEEIGPKVRVEISDNGAGIDEEIQDKIFAEGFTTRQGSGCGYGLAIVKDLVAKNQGEIKIISPYKTSRFESVLRGTQVILKFHKIKKG
jgi:signal transduction histidine kinase